MLLSRIEAQKQGMMLPTIVFSRGYVGLASESMLSSGLPSRLKKGRLLGRVAISSYRQHHRYCESKPLRISGGNLTSPVSGWLQRLVRRLRRYVSPDTVAEYDDLLSLCHICLLRFGSAICRCPTCLSCIGQALPLWPTTSTAFKIPCKLQHIFWYQTSYCPRTITGYKDGLIRTQEKARGMKIHFFFIVISPGDSRYFLCDKAVTDRKGDPMSINHFSSVLNWVDRCCNERNLFRFEFLI
jgi:hypothetical protein